LKEEVVSVVGGAGTRARERDGLSVAGRVVEELLLESLEADDGNKRRRELTCVRKGRVSSTVNSARAGVLVIP
jgi:hypothetical protein